MAVTGIFTALSGMSAHRRILDTTANNIANQITPGYKRQVVDLAPVSVGSAPAVFAGSGNRALGVEVVDTRRVVDQLAEMRSRNAMGAATDASTTRDAMLRIEAVFDEPSERGLSTQLNAFWVSWSDLSDRADDTVARGEVLARAGDLVNRMGQIATDLERVDIDAGRRIDSLVSEINSKSAQIAELNKAIAGATGTPNALMDQRDVLATELADMVGADIRYIEEGDQMSVTVGGRLLVAGGSSFEVQRGADTIEWALDGTPMRPAPSELAALNRIQQELLPGVRAQLDTTVAEIVTEVNAVHSAGYGLDGVTGRDFFDPTGLTAQTMAVDADIVGQTDRLAAGAGVLPGPTAPGPFDGRQAQLLGDLAVDGAADQNYRTFVGELGIEVGSWVRRADSNQQIADRALNDAESVSGVSIDEEMVRMLAAQRGYEASARMLRAVDEMLETVINIMR